MNSIYDSLSIEQTYLMAIYTLFDTEESKITKLKGIMDRLLGTSFLDFNLNLKPLKSSGLLIAHSYNWRTDSYDYSIAEEHLIPFMLYLVEHKKELTLKVLDAAKKKLYPSPIQRFVWTYITCDFKNIDYDDIEEYEIDKAIGTFLPVVTDSRFAALLLSFDSSTFFQLVDIYLSKIFVNEGIVDSDYLSSLIKSFDSDGISSSYTLRLLCLIDLYNYMVYGKMPQELFKNNKNHQIIAALYNAYKGNNTIALEHFKKAVLLNNKSNNRGYITTLSKSYLALNIANFFYVLVAFKTGTEDGRKKCISVTRMRDNSLTVAATVLNAILQNTATEKQLENSLRELLTDSERINRSLAVLMCYYLGKQKLIEDSGITSPDYMPRWCILKQEMRKYVPLDDNRTYDKNYGEQGLLSTIYHKQEWEFVLEDLLGMGTPDASVKPKEKDMRIGYFMDDMHQTIVHVRQQPLLKSGKWGAGKNVKVLDFLEGTLEGMEDSDRRISMQARKRDYYRNDISLSFVLPEMTEESRLYVGHYSPYSLVSVIEEMPYLTLNHETDGFRISSNVPIDQIENSIIITHRGAASINFIHLKEDQRPYYRRLLSLGYFPEEAEEQLRGFLNSLGGKVEVNSDLIDGGSTLPITQGVPQLVMQMRPQGRETYVVGIFVRPLNGGRIKCAPGVGDEIIVDNGQWIDEEGETQNCRVRVQRNLQQEKENIEHFKKSCSELLSVYRNIDDNYMTEVDAYDLLPLLEYAQKNTDIVSCEWPEGSSLKIKQKQTTSLWNGAIKKNDNGWFEIEGSVELDQGKVVTMAQLLDLASKSRGRFIKLNDGEFLALSEKLRRQLKQLGAITSRSKGKLVMSPFSVALLGRDVTDGELFLEEDEEVKAIRKRIKESSKYSPDVPKTLNATLREYQKEGYQWMSRLNKWGAGALLADDMGLGKTIQTITFLLSKANEGPALVIAPASVAPNWKTEFDKFAPSLNVTMLNFATNRTEAIKNAKAGDVVVTTYGLLLSVKDDITTKQWTTICLDEAHIVKNRGAKTSAVAMQLKSENRVMLTGTPVQNHLGELWNLFQFVNPGLLGGFEDFNRRFILPIEQDGDKEVQGELDRLVKPFMLRRTKDKVAKELPEKEEIYQHVDLNEDELLVYEALRQRAEAMLMAEEGGSVSMTTLAEITRLRQCACDVRLIEEGKKSKTNANGSKIIALVELLSTVLEGFEEGKNAKKKADATGGVLVFSQFTSYLSLIKKALDEASIPYLYIDGSVPIKERQRLVEKFQAGECPVFLISLKAGGLGLNLTRANYVIHMDPWWNPAIEAQATDRAHRIGQKQAVTVYHLIAEGTIEEKIQRMHEQKRELVENILESTDMSHKLTGEELLKLVHS